MLVLFTAGIFQRWQTTSLHQIKFSSQSLFFQASPQHSFKHFYLTVGDVSFSKFDVETSDEDEIEMSGFRSKDGRLAPLSVATSRNARRTPPAARRFSKLRSSAKSRSHKARSLTLRRAIYTSRHSVSDKENDGEEDIEERGSLSLVCGGPLVDKELKRAKRKFEVADCWELEFEDDTPSSLSL
jgi:hypothetical protein